MCACNPNRFLGTSNHAKYQKVTEKCSQLDTQNPSKIDKNPPWDSQEPPGCTLATNDLQNGAKMVSQDPLNASKIVPKTNKKQQI